MPALKHWRAYIFLYGTSIPLLALLWGSLSVGALAASAIAVGALIVIADLFTISDLAKFQETRSAGSSAAPAPLGKRRESRHRTHFRTGSIKDAGGDRSPCMIIDRSPNGARVLLILNEPKDIRGLSLYDESERTWYAAEVAWQNGKELGLRLEVR